jgi:hypothetical protein
MAFLVLEGHREALPRTKERLSYLQWTTNHPATQAKKVHTVPQAKPLLLHSATVHWACKLGLRKAAVAVELLYCELNAAHAWQHAATAPEGSTAGHHSAAVANACIRVSSLVGLGYCIQVSSLVGLGYCVQVSSLVGLGYCIQVSSLVGLGYCIQVSSLVGLGYCIQVSSLVRPSYCIQVSSLVRPSYCNYWGLLQAPSRLCSNTARSSSLAGQARWKHRTRCHATAHTKT